MERLRFAITTLVILFLATVGGLGLGRMPVARVEAPLCTLIVPSSALQLGEVWETDRYDWKVPVTNVGKQAIEVKSFYASCGCVKVTPASATIKPGETLEIALQLDLTKGEVLPPWERTGSRRWSTTVVPVLANPSLGRSPTWDLNGRVRTPLRLTAMRIECGLHSVLNQSGFGGQMIINATVPLLALSARCVHPALEARVEKDKTDSSYFYLSVKQVQPLSRGEISSEVILTPQGEGKEKLPEQRVHLRGLIVDDVQVRPETLLLGSHRVGQQVERAVLVHSLTGRPFVVERIEAPEGVEVQPIPVGDRAGGPHYLVTQTIKAGAQQTRIHFVLASDSDWNEVAELNVLWHGSN